MAGVERKKDEEIFFSIDLFDEYDKDESNFAKLKREEEILGF